MLHQMAHIITGLQVVSDQDFIKHDCCFYQIFLWK